MFQDLSNTSLTKISPERTKASPSVYSENDGSFNSEENLRWISRKITSKPYIVGKDTEDVNKSLVPSVSSQGMYIGKGMFDIDGYLFKIEGGDEQISYDSSDNDYAPLVLNTQHVQRFVGDMIRYGDQDKEIRCEYSDFCFSEYDPGNQNNNVSDVKELWETALAEHNVIGFVRIVYNSEYLSQLDNSGHGTMLYKDSSGNIIGSLAVRNYISSAYMTPDEIRSNIFNGGVDQYTSICNEFDSELHTYYPVYVETDDNDSAAIVFTDVFGFTWQHAVRKFNTSTYPSTVSNLIDMDASSVGAQNPFSGVSQFQCKLNTYPNNRYMYNMLYDSGSSYIRKTSGVSGSIQSNMRTFSHVQKFRISDLHFNISSEIIPSVENNLSYYCITDIPDNMKLTNGVYTRPVALFTSEGSLCTDGLITGLSTNYAYDGAGGPIESYVHFIKRRYLMDISEGQWSEDAIKDVTREQVVNWDDFSTFYNTYIAPAMSEYLNLCYYSLMDNVFYGTESTDYKNIKMHNCGKYIQNVTGTTAHEFSTDYTFEATIHENGSVTPEQVQKTLRFESDTTSDKYKTRLFVDKNSGSVQLLDGLTYYRQYVFDSENSDMQLMLEDPLLFLRCCVGSAFGVSNMNLTLPNGSIATIGGNVQVDEYFAPKKQIVDDTCFELSTYNSILRSNNEITSSVASSLSYSFYRNTWEMRIPTTISINKTNLNYLCGRNYDDPTKYDGFTFGFKMPHEVEDSELYVFDTLISSCRQGEAYDVEQSSRLPFYASEKIRIKREAFIHTSKIYGDNNKDFEHVVKDVTDDIISEALDGNDLSIIKDTQKALIDKINYEPKNLLQFNFDNESLYPKYPVAEFFKINENSNVSFKLDLGNGVVYVHIDPYNGQRIANADSTLSVKFGLSKNDVCLTGCPSGGSVDTYYCDVKNSNGDVILIDTGDYDDINHTSVGNHYDHLSEYTYDINILAGTEQSSDFIFRPMVSNYRAYILTDTFTQYVPTNAKLHQDLSSLSSTVEKDRNITASLVNSPDKNLLSIYSGSIRNIPIQISERFDDRKDYVFYAEYLGSSYQYATETNISIYDDADRRCYYSTVQLGTNKSKTIKAEDIEYQGRPISYMILGAHDGTANEQVTFSNIMLCTLEDWNISNKYVDGNSNIERVLRSVVDRPTKNMLSSDFTGTFHPSIDEPELRIDFEFPIQSDLYMLSASSIVSTGYYDQENPDRIRIRFLRSNGTYTDYKYVGQSFSDVVFNRSFFSTLYKYKAILLSTEHMSDIHTSGHLMFCKMSDFDVSESYVPSVSMVVEDSVSSIVDPVKESVASLIDSGSKNMINCTSATEVTYVDIPCHVQAGTYTLSFESLTSDDTDASVCKAEFTDSSTNVHGTSYIQRGNNVNASINVDGESTNIRIYASDSYANSENDNITATNAMLCTSYDWKLSNKYVDYCPTVQEIYEMIQNIQSQLQ